MGFDDIITIVSLMVVIAICAILYLYSSSIMRKRYLCEACGSEDTLEDFLGVHKALYLGGADAVVCSSCGTVRITNKEFLESLLFMCNNALLLETFVNVFRKFIDDYKSNNGMAEVADELERYYYEFINKDDPEYFEDFISERREQAFSRFSKDLPTDRFIKVCLLELRELATEIEDSIMHRREGTSIEQPHRID